MEIYEHRLKDCIEIVQAHYDDMESGQEGGYYDEDSISLTRIASLLNYLKTLKA